ncbi:unnamed protein product [Mytilus coruscus]|uniref:CCHC-type domain-containing protein n=1 Tax=Mytilus coruscus TaxID=42192 RepID=A0A6J8D3D0_MYTCO|nr:unnamed protein product [Mytilus coruscus]
MHGRKWKEELNLYIDLVMDSEDEQAKVKLFLYLVSTRGREIYLTMFDQEPQNRTLEMVLQAFDGYCNPKRNETVERYRFNMRNQNREKTLTSMSPKLKKSNDLQLWSTARVTYPKQNYLWYKDSHLRERLLRVIDLDLPKCLQISRAAELSKERIKTLENPTFSDLEVHGVKHKQRNPNYQQQKQYTHKTKPSYAQTSSACKYCGRKHEFNKAKFPAFGKECRKCGKANHFESMCKSEQKSRQRRHPGHRVRAIHSNTHQCKLC